MKIQIIGTGSMWTKYNSACYLIDDYILIDMPNGACKSLYKIDIIPNTINHVILTHFHGDHYFDMPFYLLNKSKSLNRKVNIYCSKDGKKKINKIFKLAFPNSYKKALINLAPNYKFSNEFNIENYKVSKLLVVHGRMKPAYAYIFKNDDKLVGFTGDTSLCDNVEFMAEKCDYLFCDCMLINGNNKHQGIDDIEYLSNKYPNCKFVVIHLEDNTREEIKMKKIVNVIVPNDYDVINI